MSHHGLGLPGGARIGLVGPSHAWSAERYAEGRQWLSQQGYSLVEVGLADPHRYYAADDATRRQGLLDALSDPDLDAVWAIRGGSGVTRILADLPLEGLPDRPLLGFSDLTPLLDAWAGLGRTAVHAPVVHSLGRTDPASLRHLAALLRGEPLEPMSGRVLVSGSASGPLVGGNLAMIAASVGTSYALDATDSILVLEDVGEHPYRLERMLAQLRDSGTLDGAAGIALGTFDGCDPPKGAAWTMDEVFEEWLAPLGVPIVSGLPIGHGAGNRAWRVRGPARLHDGALTLD